MRSPLVLLTLTACAQFPGAPGATFTLSGPDPAAFTLPQGGSQTTQIVLAPEGGFRGRVNLFMVNGHGDPAPGFTVAPPSVWLSGEPVSQTLEVSALEYLAPGTYALKLRAQSGSIVRERDLSVTVVLTLIPKLQERTGSTYFVGVYLGQTLRAYQGVQFRIEAPLGFTLSFSPGPLTQECLPELHPLSQTPNVWNALLVCEARRAFQGPGQVGTIALMGAGEGMLSLTHALVVREGSYQEEPVHGGNLWLAP
ncbi:hypothetical protein [Thermus brockianus]|uniref:Lipoprotein n=1 Tax=Thermus brockianus TaxID=56956 RepID=A0ABM7XMN8_THEBO|nr:hypothetical protein [Thermus brockianus]BDG17632.1 hypothetical protein TbrSNM41_23660 [Thermus brockianus]